MDDSNFRDFCAAILDDDLGVRQFVYDDMIYTASREGWLRSLHFLKTAVDCTDGRWYLKTEDRHGRV